MNAVPRRDVLAAAAALAGVAVLGLFMGLETGPAPPIEEAGSHGAAGPGQWRPGMASAIEARALAPDALPPSSEPAKLASAAPTLKEDQGDAAANENPDNSSDAPAPPELYAPPGPAPSTATSAPAADDTNLPPF